MSSSPSVPSVLDSDPFNLGNLNFNDFLSPYNNDDIKTSSKSSLSAVDQFKVTKWNFIWFVHLLLESDNATVFANFTNTSLIIFFEGFVGSI